MFAKIITVKLHTCQELHDLGIGEKINFKIRFSFLKYHVNNIQTIVVRSRYRKRKYPFNYFSSEDFLYVCKLQSAFCISETFLNCLSIPHIA